MNIVVLDSSTLILLARTDLLKMVNLYYHRILIPQQVFRETVEIGKNENKEDAFIIEKEIEHKRINVLRIRNIKQLNFILKEFKVGLGEAEALILVMEKNATLLVDDYEAMKICKIYNIEFITALAFLVKLVEDDKIEKEEALIKFSILSKLGYYSKEILNYAIRECNKKWSK